MESKYSKLALSTTDDMLGKASFYRSNEQDGSFDELDIVPGLPRNEFSKFWNQRAVQVPLKIAALLLISSISFICGWKFQGVDERNCVDTAWDELRQAVKFKTLEFNPHFHGPKSPYMGTPNENLDRLWYDLAKIRNFAVDRETLEKLNRTQGAVQYPNIHRYQVGMEVFHQIHCLNYLRMYTFKDYYSKVDFDMLRESDEERQDHKNHCVEALRQRLMCNADLNIYSYHWMSKSDLPLGNLYTRHRCIDWDSLYAWAEEHPVLEEAPHKGPDTEILHWEFTD